MISLAASNSEAYALPMRPKEEVSNLTTLFNDDSKPSLPRSSILDQSRRPRNGFKIQTTCILDGNLTDIQAEYVGGIGYEKPWKSIISEIDCRPRKSKAVGFGVVEEAQFTPLSNENRQIIQSESDMMKPGTSRIKSNQGQPSAACDQVELALQITDKTVHRPIHSTQLIFDSNYFWNK